MKQISGLIVLIFYFSLVSIAQEKQVELLALRTVGVKINVPDMNKAILFYRDRLGFEIEPYQQSAREVFFKIPGRIKLSLRQVNSLRPPEPTDTRVSFTLQVNDLDQTIATLKERGVEFAVSEKRKEGIGFSTAIKDPFGGRLSLIHVTTSKIPPFKEPRLYNFGFYIPDMELARGFYAQKLGLIELTVNFLPLDMPLGQLDKSFAFMLHYRPDGIKPVKIKFPKSWASHTVVFETANLDETVAKLKKSGVKTLKQKGVVVFEDPFGNISELVESTSPV